jgi:hypothetical protein
MVAKCGEYRVWHWSHLKTRTCDHWWESQTEWHRAWKNHFPKSWQEFIHQSDAGKKHFADVKTESGVVLEFQYSHIQPQERQSREMFYQKMVWVVCGVRLKRDRAKFFGCVDLAAVIKQEPLIVSVGWKEGALLRDWGGSRVPVYFDFPDMPFLWRLNPRAPNGAMYLRRVPRKGFLDLYLKGMTFEQEALVSAKVERAAAEAQRAAARYYYLMQRARRPKGPGPRL